MKFQRNKSIRSLDLETKIGTESDFLDLFETRKNRVLVSFVNPFSYSILSGKHNIISQFDWYSDGALLCFLSNIYRKSKIDRVSFDFSSVADSVFSECANRNLKVALIGGVEGEANVASEYIKSRHASVQICYARNGYLSRCELDKVVNELNVNQIDVVIVGMGTPHQEEFILNIKNDINAQYFFTCGGFITQTASKGDYYHPMVKKLGLRWLQRAIKHEHVRSRLFKVYPAFITHYFMDIIFKRYK